MIALSVLVLNLRKVQCAFLWLLHIFLTFEIPSVDIILEIAEDIGFA